MSKKISFALGAAISLLLITAVAAIAAVSAGNTGWFWGNPLPQGNSLTTVDAVAARVYAAGASGTLLRSDDSGASWSSIRTGLLDDIQLVRAVSADSVVFASSCALRRTDDGGSTVKRLIWGGSDEACPVKIRSFYFPNATTGYLLLRNGDVYQTADGGESWNKQHAVPQSVSAGGNTDVGDIWFTSPSNGVATIGTHIYRTTDGANSWAPVLNGNQNYHGFNFVDTDHGFVVGGGGAVLTTIDAGATWLPATAGGGATASTGGSSGELSSIDCADVNTCVATATNGDGITRTEDGGTTWQSVSPTSGGLNGAVFTSATRVVAVASGGVTVASNDKGANWSTLSSGAAGPYSGIRAQSATAAFAFGNNGALARTTDGGKSWTPLSVATSQNLIDVAFPNATRGYVLDATGVLLRSNNGGSSWQFLDSGTNADPRGLFAPDAATLLLAGPRGIRRSSNSGDDFSAAAGKNLKKSKVGNFDRAGTAIFAYGTRAIWVSGLSGKSWKGVPAPKKLSGIRKLDMISAKAGYLLDSKSELWFTKTRGKKWVRIETTGANYAYSMAFGDLKHGYLTDNAGRILYTADAGSTWSRQYPFYDAGGISAAEIAAPSATGAFLLVKNTNRLFATSSNGLISSPSALTIKSSSKKVRKNTVVKVTGKLSPALEGARVAVLARLAGAKGGVKWTTQERTVSASGTFSTSWRIKKPTIFIARWSGDSAHDGDAATGVRVIIRKK
jgi:photosystem II stability/assembly factor-like uncharacterized protein